MSLMLVKIVMKRDKPLRRRLVTRLGRKASSSDERSDRETALPRRKPKDPLKAANPYKTTTSTVLARFIVT